METSLNQYFVVGSVVTFSVWKLLFLRKIIKVLPGRALGLVFPWYLATFFFVLYFSFLHYPLQKALSFHCRQHISLELLFELKHDLKLPYTKIK